MLSLFGVGPLIYVSVLLLNSVAILSEDRFLARSKRQPTPPRAYCTRQKSSIPLLTTASTVGWGRAHLQQSEPSFGQSNDPESLKSRVVNLISSIRMVTRGMLTSLGILSACYRRRDSVYTKISILTARYSAADCCEYLLHNIRACSGLKPAL